MHTIRTTEILAGLFLAAALFYASLFGDPTAISQVDVAMTVPPAGLLMVVSTVLLGVASKVGRTPKI